MDIPITDLELLNWLNHHFLPGTIPVLKSISAFTTFLSIFLTLLVLILYLVRKKPPVRYFFILTTVLIVVGITSQGLKHLVDRERPYRVHASIQKLSDGGGSSFPSGHTMEVFAMAMALSVLYRKKWIIFSAFLWAFAVAYSRIALGVHYPTDVFAGLIIGIIIGLLVPLIFFRFGNQGKTG